MSRHKLFARAAKVAALESSAEAPRSETIIFTRACLSRNLAGAAFPAKMPNKDALQACSLLEKLLAKTADFKSAAFVPLSALDNAELRLIGETLFSGAFYPCEKVAASFATSKAGDCAALLNFEDHLSLFSFAAGFAPSAALARAQKQEQQLHGWLDFAKDSAFGFLCADPERTGSGLKLSCLLHLGALHRTGRLDAALRHARSLGFAWKALGGDGADITSDFYLLSGPPALGSSPEEAMENLEKTVQFLSLGEKGAADWLHRPGNRAHAADDAFRALALLSSARLMSYEETLSHLSTLKTAAPHLDDLHCPPQHELNGLVLMCQPAHIALSEGKKRLAPPQRDEKRACLLRQAFSRH